MECPERPGQGAAREGLHHGSLHFHELPLVKEPPDETYHGAPQAEHIGLFRIHYQIEVSLPVAQFNVLEAVPFLRKGMEAFRQEREGLGHYCQFSGAGLEEGSLDGEDITNIQERKSGIYLRTDLICPYVDLQPLPAVGEVEERGFSHLPDRHHPAGGLDADSLSLERLGVLCGIFFGDFMNPMGDIHIVREDIDTLLLQALELGLTGEFLIALFLFLFSGRAR